MFERFTDRARKCMALANQQAQRFNHEYLGTEHILLGILAEGGGAGVQVVRSMGVSPDAIRSAIEGVMVRDACGPIALGKQPHTPRSRRVIESAIDAAAKLGHNYVGTEHLMIGLLSDDDGVAGVTLRNFGLTAELFTKAMLDLLNKEAEKKAERAADTAEELDVIGKAVAVFKSLQPEAHCRVLSYLNARFGMKESPNA